MNKLNGPVRVIAWRISYMFLKRWFLKNLLSVLYMNIIEKKLLREMWIRILFRGKYVKVIFKKQGFSLMLKDNPSDDIYALKWYFLEYMPKKWDIVVDCWAYIWFTSLYLSKIVWDHWVVLAFEPDDVSYSLLQEHIRINNVKNIRSIKKWIWKHDGYLSFDWIGAGFHVSDAGKSKLPVITLETELKNQHITTVDFIKMDIEWSEIEVAESLKNFLLHHTWVHMAIASYHYVDGKQTYVFLEKFFKSIWYNVKTWFKEHLTTYASKI